MPVRPFDICQARMVWHGCEDSRPCVIVDVLDDDTLGCFPIASRCYGGGCFWIDQDHPDFAATGLARGCYVHGTHIIDIAHGDVIRRRGRLTHELVAEFRRYAGI